MGRTEKLGKNLLLISLGSIGSKALTFLLVPLYTAVLSTEEYGISEVLITTVSLLMPIFTMTISESMLRFPLDSANDKKQIFTSGVIVNIIGFLVLLALSPVILYIDILKPYYKLFILYYFGVSVYNSLSCFTSGRGHVALSSIVGIFQTLFLVISNIILLVFLHWGLEGYLISFIISYLVSSFVLFVLDKQYYLLLKPNKIDLRMTKEMLWYSIPMIPNSISWWISNSSDKYMLTYFCGSEINGLYSVAYKVPTLLMVFYGIFMSAWRLSATEDFGSHESTRFYNTIYKTMTVVLSVFAGFIILFNYQLSHFFYSNDFFEARFFVPVLVMAVMFHGIAEYYGTIYTSSKQTKMLFYSSFVGAVVNVILNFSLIPVWNGYGAAISTLVSYLIILLFRAFHSRKILFINSNDKVFMLTILLLFMMTSIQTIEINNSFTISTCIYITILFLNRNPLIKILEKLKTTLYSKLYGHK